MLEEDEAVIQKIVDIALPLAPDYDEEKILEKLKDQRFKTMNSNI